MHSAPVVETRQLQKRFGAVEAVRGIDLEVRRGEIFGFLGPNGAGKSTTISILCTLLRPSGGSARVAGFDVARHPNEVRARIGLVFQDPSLDVQLTARENLEFHAFLYDVPSPERRARIGEVLEMVQLTDRADSLVMTFSGGMKRRLEIARGVLHTPEVLFLDEPTIGLDTQTRRHIWGYLNELPARGVTIFMTTHYMEEAEYCDRIAIIDHGLVRAVGTPEELKAMVGGDVVTITTADDAAAAPFVQALAGVAPTSSDDGALRVEVPDAASFVPKLVRDLPIEVTSVAFRRPSLDDVFIKLTGRAIRAEEGDLKDTVRLMGRAWRRG